MRRSGNGVCDGSLGTSVSGVRRGAGWGWIGCGAVPAGYEQHRTSVVLQHRRPEPSSPDGGGGPDSGAGEPVYGEPADPKVSPLGPP